MQSVIAALGAAIAHLDSAHSMVQVPRYAELRHELVGLYLDLLAGSTRPFDYEAERDT